MIWCFGEYLSLYQFLNAVSLKLRNYYFIYTKGYKMSDVVLAQNYKLWE